MGYDCYRVGYALNQANRIAFTSMQTSACCANDAGEALTVNNNAALVDLGSSWDFFDGVVTGGIEMEWGGGKHQARLAPADKVAWVMSPDSPEWRDLELTTNPVWRVAVANTGITPSTENVQRMEKWGQFASVKTLPNKARWSDVERS